MVTVTLSVAVTAALLGATAPPVVGSSPCAELHACATGQCTDQGGRCTWGSDDDCLLTPDCAESGMCHYDQDAEECAPIAPDACRSSPACWVSGLCAGDATSEDAPCVATADGCAASAQCRLDGECAVAAGECVASAPGCAGSAACRYRGGCALTPGTRSLPAFCGATEVGCRQSVLCSWFGTCAFDSGRCVSSAESCAQAQVCRRLGWCEPGASDGARVSRWDATNGTFAPCYARTCAETPACRRWGACTPDTRGGCVVAPQSTPACGLHRVVGLTATATSARSPERGYRFDAGRLVDHDARTAWVAADGKGAGETVTVRLPKAERVARLWVRNTSELQDPRWDASSRRFGRLLHGVVHVGDRVEMFYDTRSSAYGPPIPYGTGPFGIPVVVPPTLTDTIAIDIDLVAPGDVRAEPAITEILVEACDQPSRPAHQ